MDRGIRNTLIGIAGFIALVLGLFLYAFLSPRAPSDEQLKRLGYFGFEQPRAVGDFSLVDQYGKPVGPVSLRGHWSLLYFGYTFCPDVCPTTLSTLASALSGVPGPPGVVMVSVDPERDSPAVLRQYLQAFSPDFAGYTGSFDEIVKLATSVNVAFGKVPGAEPGTYLVDHSANIVVIDPRGRYAGFIKPSRSPADIASIVTGLMR